MRHEYFLCFQLLCDDSSYIEGCGPRLSGENAPHDEALVIEILISKYSMQTNFASMEAVE